jgi:hypothetical protein
MIAVYPYLKALSIHKKASNITGCLRGVIAPLYCPPPLLEESSTSRERGIKGVRVTILNSGSLKNQRFFRV